ncbi:MAG TPA: DegT/DnrJ/EryC1/StrS family aminotransferase [Xanthobacteraceae bacterium]|nr:DegT/DnrJ/EryC1/StrS family aminotransferase [Xanthobacteraceae bacterium]
MSPPRIPYVDLAAQYAEERAQLLPVIDQVLASGGYVGGGIINRLEGKLAALCQVKHAVVLNSGTDALILGMRALGIGAGDEVITPPNSFVASTAAIVQIGARPVFADVLADQNVDPERIASAITPRTKAIMPVHLTGRIADMDAIMELARAHGLLVIEDAAQAIGSSYRERPAGSFGDVGCFSTHPLKNLNAIGDGGFITTDRDDVAARVRLLRNHGLIDRNSVAEFGLVSRMDALQAAVLEFRLDRLDDIIRRRRANAARYRELLDFRRVFVPADRQIEFNSYHLFVIQTDRRDSLQQHLAQKGIGTAVHYPIPIHLQPAAASLGYGRGDFPVTERQAERILSLPVNQSLDGEQITTVAEEINRFLA